MNYKYLKFFVGIVSLLLLLAACTTKEEAEIYLEPNAIVQDILVSTSADRSNAKPLDTSWVAGDVYTFIKDTPGLSGANFYLDDVALSGAPFRQMRGLELSAGEASDVIDTTSLADGVHTLTAELLFDGAATRVVTATFLVDNNDDERDVLLVSESPQRTDARSLSGATLADDAYIFLIPSERVRSVAFYFDGTLRQTERIAFYDAAGTANDGSAWPFDTTSLSDRQHTVKAVITSNAGTQEVSASFTVRNAAPPPNPTPNPPPPTDSTNLCEGLPTNKDKVIIPRLNKPGFLEPYADPAFGAKVTRITNTAAGSVIKPMYNTIQAWNADETRMILFHTGGPDGSGHHLYNGNTYERIKKLDIIPADIEEVFWDATDANSFFYISKDFPDNGTLFRYDVRDDTQEEIKRFADVCGERSYPGGGNDVQMMSLDADTIGLRCRQATSANPVGKTFYYRISTDIVSDTVTTGEGTPYLPWNSVQPAPSGERFFLNGYVLDENLEVERRLDTTRRSSGKYKPEHAVLGQTSGGQDAFYSVIYNRVADGCEGDANGGVGALTAYNMETGQCRVLVGMSNGYGYPVSSTHPSALSYKNPGWVAVSSVGAQSQTGLIDSGEKVPTLFSEIYLANEDPNNPQVCRVAHHRSFGKGASGDYTAYFGEPHPVLSPSGTRILFGSDWNNSGSVDTYVIELPAHGSTPPPPPPPPSDVKFDLTINKGGSGAGTVTSRPAGLDCGTTCSAEFIEDTRITLTAEPGADNVFAGWGGACAGSGASCVITLNEDTSVAATFNEVTTPPPPPPPPTSANLCEGFRTDTQQISIPRLAKPAPLSTYTDPALGAQITRVSSARSGGVVKPMYNTVQAWNADESRMILYHAGTEDSGHHLYNGRTYERIGRLEILPADIEQVFWDPTDARYFYYVNKGQPDYGDLIRYNVTNNQKTAIKTFDNLCGSGNYPSGGNDVQMISWDGDVIGLKCTVAATAKPSTFSYRISTDTLSPIKTIGQGTDYEPWYAAQPAPSGDRFFLGGDVLDSNLNRVRRLDSYRNSSGVYKAEHSVLGQLKNGDDALFAVAFNASPNGCDGGASNGVGSLVSHNLRTGECRVLVGQDNGYTYPLSGIHPSALSFENPGWVAVSSIGQGSQLNTYLNNNQPAPVLLSELYLADTDASNPQVCRLAHTRTYGKAATNGGYASYFGEPHPVISPSGTRILFGSDWYDSGSVDTYVVELPAYQP